MFKENYLKSVSNTSTRYSPRLDLKKSLLFNEKRHEFSSFRFNKNFFFRNPIIVILLKKAGFTSERLK